MSVFSSSSGEMKKNHPGSNNSAFFPFVSARVFVFNCILLSSLNCLPLTAHYTTSIISDLKFLPFILRPPDGRVDCGGASLFSQLSLQSDGFFMCQAHQEE